MKLVDLISSYLKIARYYFLKDIRMFTEVLNFNNSGPFKSGPVNEERVCLSYG